MFDSSKLTLHNPIEHYSQYIFRFLENIRTIDTNSGKSIGTMVLNSIKSSLDAEYVFIVGIKGAETDKNIVYKQQSDYDTRGINIEEYKSLAIHKFHELFSPEEKSLEKLPEIDHGAYSEFQSQKGLREYIIAIPIQPEHPRTFLMIFGKSQEIIAQGELISCLVKSIYNSTDELNSLQLLDVETAILNDLKHYYRFLPAKLYNYSFEIFKEKLRGISIAFEPIVYLGKQLPEIHFWEALARDSKTNKVPSKLFETAELWGPRFITELDIYLLNNSVDTYLELWKNEHYNLAPDLLSVNVYPETIFRTAYKTELKNVIEKEKLQPKQLQIEISEKRPTPPIEQHRENGLDEHGIVEEYAKAISKHIKDLRVGFVIDDFGVGYSSISRLIKLNPDYIKIDRDILFYSFPEATIDFLMKFLNTTRVQPGKVIVDGFDGESRISLKKLYDHGIRLIQGKAIREASLSVSPLSQEEQKFIIRQLSS